MARLIRDLLDVAALEAGQLAVQTAPVGLAAVLREAAGPVTSAASAEEALGHLAEADVALVDVNLPGMSGVELVNRAHELAPALTCILMTGDDRGDVSPGVQRLLKPVKLEAVLAALAEPG